MARISKKELKKELTELEKKVSELDPENVFKELNAAIEQIYQFEKNTKGRLHEKMDDFISSRKKLVQIFLSRILNAVKETFGPIEIEEKPKKAEPEEAPGD